jgi:uncharacterized protein YyaL (SSP411 family)
MSHKYTNALAKEKSPYLQQHAHNPVDWLPWGEAAFEKARKEDKPILLSIGYSTCHWCHVMERESFENEDIAAVLNEHFINIKVDREERPDVDLSYMTYVQAVNGNGGWPMNVWLTPELKPFFGGTYFPPEDKNGRMGFKRLSEEIARVWREDKANVVARSHETVEKLQGFINDEQNAHDASFDTVSKKAYDDISSAFDYHEGGFSSAPKFPRPVTLNLLWRLRIHLARHEETASDANWAETMAKTTLTKMAHGGMRDHLGGGFHRYSVDGYWHIPHYEKMLYDQAQLTVAYLEGHQNTGSQLYANIARSILDYCQRDLSHPDGGFFSAEDADSYKDSTLNEKSEGAFYIWTAAEIDELLGKQEGSIFRYAYGARRDGNARPESDPQGELKGTNTLFRAFSVKKTAEFFKLEEAQVDDILTRGRATLLAARNQRPRPHLDDKIITAWNGMMLTALAKAGTILNEPAYLERATRCAGFLHQHLSTDGKNLRRSWRNDVADDLAFAPDYALLIQGLLDLYEATFQIRWLQWAVDLQQEFDNHYGDPEKGGYYTVSKNIPNSVLQVKEDYDGAEPSPNSIATLNLLRLANMLARDSYRDTAAKTLNLFGQSMENSPITVPAMVTALDYQQHGNMEIVFAGPLSDPTMQELIQEVRRTFLPHAVLLHIDGGEAQAYLAQGNEAIVHMQPVGGKPSVYVCKNHTCQAPVTTVSDLQKALQIA